MVSLDEKSARLDFTIPDTGVIVTAATVMGLAVDAEPLPVEILKVCVVDSIDVVRYTGKRIPGKIAANARLTIWAKCPNAIAISIVLACAPRRVVMDDGAGDDVIDQDAEFSDDKGDAVT